jgi:hypothetical protein
MAVAIAPALPWLSAPTVAGANTYYVPPTGAIQTPAIVWRPTDPWIERQETYRQWVERYVAVCVVLGGPEAVEKLYSMALAIKEAIDQDPALASWRWEGVGGIVETDQAGFTYLAAAVRLSFSASY